MGMQPSSTPRPRLLIIFNPTAGQRRQQLLARTVTLLLRDQWDITLKPTHAAGDATQLAMAAVRDAKYACVCAAGGDGTINEVLNGLIAAGGHTVPLGLIPLGTANVLAHELGYGSTPASWAKTITHGTAKQVHAGCYNGRYFVCMAGVGFDAQAVVSVNSRLKKLMGKGAYVLAILKLLHNLPKRAYQLTIDGQPAGTAAAVIASNGRYYAGRFVLAPTAALDKPQLDFVLFRRGGLLGVLQVLATLPVGLVARLPGVVIVPGSSLTISNHAGDPVQADGDHIGDLPGTIELAQNALTLIR